MKKIILMFVIVLFASGAFSQTMPYYYNIDGSLIWAEFDSTKLRALYVTSNIEGKTGGSNTYIVAANNSSTRSKLQADFVCNGTNDHLTVQAAIDTLASIGGSVLLLEGTYVFATVNGAGTDDYCVIIETDSVNIVGVGRSTFISVNSSAAVVGSKGAFYFKNSDKSSISNLYIDGNVADGVNTAGIVFQECDDFKIENVTIKDTDTHFVGLHGVHRGTVDKCVFNMSDTSATNTSHGLDVDESTTQSDNIIITNCYINNLQEQAIKIENTTVVTITNNICYSEILINNDLTANNDNEDIIIANNHVYNNDISLSGRTGEISVTGNYLDAGIIFTALNSGDGVGVPGGSANISGNTINNAEGGIQIVESPGIYTINNNVIDSVITANTAININAATLPSGERMYINATGNTIRLGDNASATVGINFTSIRGSIIANNLIVGGDRGITLSNSDSNYVSNNVLRNQKRHAIYLPLSDYNYIANNFIKECAAADGAILETTGTNNTFLFNKSLNNVAGLVAGKTSWTLEIDANVVIGHDRTGVDSSIVIIPSGLAGFGKVAPANRITVLPSASGDGITVREADDGSNAVEIFASNSRGWIDVKNDGGIATRIESGANSFFQGGNLGIGTNTPTAHLNVESANINDEIARFSNARTGDDSTVVINSQGYIGMGTPNPDHRLDIAGKGNLALTGVDPSTDSTVVDTLFVRTPNLVLTPNAASNVGTSVADDAAITVTNSIMRMVGADADALLDTDPAINDGAYDGQLVIIQGTADGNTVTIADNVNTQLAGGASMTLGDGDILQLLWDSNYSMWIEIARSDN